MSDPVTCSMCGYRFDPQAHLACQSCPVNHGCQVVCCPSCGYQWADPQQLSPGAVRDALAGTGCTGQQKYTSNLSDKRPL